MNVESFLMLSGALVCFTFLNARDKGVKFSLFRYYLRRYIRLAPTFYMVLFLTATARWSLLIPLSKANFVPTTEYCMKTGWLGLFFVENYLEMKKMCLPITWSINIDMQLFWLSPLILFPLWRRPKLGKALLSVLILVGLITAFTNSYVHQLEASSDYLIGSTEQNLQYIPTYTRFTPWLIGIGLGYLLQKTKNTSTRLSRGIVTSGWILSTCLILGAWLLKHPFYQPDYQYGQVFTSLYTALNGASFALGIAWLIFACARGYGGFVNSFLSCQLFQVLSRFSYSVYLTHFALIGAYILAQTTPKHYNDFTMVVSYAGIVAASLCLGFVTCLLVELPAINLGRELLDKSKLKVKLKD